MMRSICDQCQHYNTCADKNLACRDALKYVADNRRVNTHRVPCVLCYQELTHPDTARYMHHLVCSPHRPIAEGCWNVQRHMTDKNSTRWTKLMHLRGKDTFVECIREHLIGERDAIRKRMGRAIVLFVDAMKTG